MSFTYTDNSHFKRRPPCNTSRTRRYPFSFYERRDEEKKRLFLFIISSKSGFEFTNAIPTRRNTSTIDVFFSGFFFLYIIFSSAELLLHSRRHLTRINVTVRVRQSRHPMCRSSERVSVVTHYIRRMMKFFISLPHLPLLSSRPESFSLIFFFLTTKEFFFSKTRATIYKIINKYIFVHIDKN